MKNFIHFIVRKKISILLLIIILSVSNLYFLKAECQFSSSVNGYIFTENQGQLIYSNGQPANDIKFYIQSNNTDIYFSNNSIGYVFNSIKTKDNLPASNQPEDITIISNRVDLNFVNSNPNPVVLGHEKSNHYYNYYYSHIKDGVTNVHSYKSIVYENIYNDINLVVYSNEVKKSFKYDFIVKPGADYNEIILQYTGAESVTIAENGNLKIITSGGTIEEIKPFAYQNINKKGSETVQTAVKCNFINDNGIIKFKVENYNPNEALIIDPHVVWSTFWGGSGADHTNRMRTDADNNIIIIGDTYSKNLRLTHETAQIKNAGFLDAFVSKFNTDGELIWTTYYGGAESEFCRGGTCDKESNVIFTGWTTSNNFPVSDNAFQKEFNPVPAINQTEGFIVKLNSFGQREWATYYGGDRDDHFYGAATDINGRVTITGWTKSKDLVVSESCFQPTFKGSEDAFLTTFDKDGNFCWGTFLGGDGSDIAFSIVYDKFTNIVLTGYTNSQKFPVTANAYQSIIALKNDIFISKFDSSGNMIYSTFLGGNEDDFGMDIQTDSYGNIVVAGITFSPDLPIFEEVFQRIHGGNSDAIIIKFDSKNIHLWTSFLGGEKQEKADDPAIGIALGIDKNQEILITGTTYSRNFPVTTDALKDTLTDYNKPELNYNDAFITRISPDGKSILWSTYLGGSSNEWGSGVITDNKNNLYACGDTKSDDFPTSDHPIQKEKDSAIDSYILKLCATIPKPIVNITGSLKFCAGDSVILEANEGFVKYKWSNGSEDRKIVIKNTDEFYITVWDTNYCDASSKVFKTVAYPLPNVQIYGEKNICLGDSTILTAGTFYSSYKWSTSEVPLIDTKPTIAVHKAGRYIVDIIDTNGCPGTAFFDVFVHPRPHPIILGPKTVCSNAKGNLYYVDNMSGSNFEWKIISDNGTITTGQGNYKVTVDWTEPGEGIIAVAETINDSRCSAYDTIKVEILKAENPEITSNNTNFYLCEGDSITLDAGYGFMSYKWSNNATTQTITVKEPKKYSVQVKSSNECPGFDTVEVKLSPKPVPIITGKSDVCEADTGVIYQTQYYEGYKYKWIVSGAEIISGEDSNIIKVNWQRVSSGKLELMVTLDSTGCSGLSEPFIVNIHPYLSPHITFIDDLSICEGDSVILDAGSGFSEYKWSNDADSQRITVFDEGIYKVTVKNEFDCEGSDFVEVKVYPLPEKPVLIYENDSLHAPPGYFYEWYLDGELIPSQTDSILIAIKTGNYSVKITNEHGCSTLSDELYCWVGIANATFAIGDSIGDTIYAKTGDFVKPYILLLNSKNLDTVKAKDYKIYIRYNRSILVPAKTYNSIWLPEYEKVIIVDGIREIEKGILDSLEFCVALGNSPCSPLVIDSVVWIGTTARNAYINSAVCITNLCEADGTRLFLPDANISLEQNRPNPFSDNTEIEFSILENSYSRLFVTDVMGRKVATLFDGILPPGKYFREFSVDNLPNGTYFYILQTPMYVLTKRMEIMK